MKNKRALTIAALLTLASVMLTHSGDGSQHPHIHMGNSIARYFNMPGENQKKLSDDA